MDAACPAPGTGGAFLAGLLQHIDCQAQTIGQTGYQALASPGSPVSLALTALLTIFIAIFGIRMLMGHTPGFGDVIAAALKVGVVLALATSWSAYRVVAYDTMLHGPAELVESIGSVSALPGAEGGLVGRLQAVDDGIVAFIVTGTGRFDLAIQPQAGSTPAMPLGRTPISDDFAFGIARVAYLTGAIGALGFVRLVAGLLLALAPLFAGLLLFETTRGFFMGWLRMLVATALGALGSAIVLGVELSILEPWLTNVLALRAAHIATAAAPLELLVMTLAFAIVLFGFIAAAARIAFGRSTPEWVSGAAHQLADIWRRSPSAVSNDVQAERQSLTGSSRAFSVAEAVAATQRREVASLQETANAQTTTWSGTRIANTGSSGNNRAQSAMNTNHRRTIRRVSASATRRSQRT